MQSSFQAPGTLPLAQLLPSVLLIDYHILYMPYLHLNKQFLRFEVTLMLLSVPKTTSLGLSAVVTARCIPWRDCG